MISRNLTDRLKRLEARAMPAGASMVIEVQFVSVEKVVTGSLLLEIAPVPYSAVPIMKSILSGVLRGKNATGAAKIVSEHFG